MGLNCTGPLTHGFFSQHLDFFLIVDRTVLYDQWLVESYSVEMHIWRNCIYKLYMNFPLLGKLAPLTAKGQLYLSEVSGQGNAKIKLYIGDRRRISERSLSLRQTVEILILGCELSLSSYSSGEPLKGMTVICFIPISYFSLSFQPSLIPKAFTKVQSEQKYLYFITQGTDSDKKKILSVFPNFMAWSTLWQKKSQYTSISTKEKQMEEIISKKNYKYQEKNSV